MSAALTPSLNTAFSIFSKSSYCYLAPELPGVHWDLTDFWFARVLRMSIYTGQVWNFRWTSLHLVCKGCWHKVPHTGWLQQGIDPLTVLEARVSGEGAGRVGSFCGLVFWGRPWALPLSWPLPWAGSLWLRWRVSALPWSLPSCSHGVLPVCVCLSIQTPLVIRTLITLHLSVTW